MEKHLNIYKLDGDRDYRISLISQFEKNNDSGLFNKKKIKDFISSTFDCDEFINQIEINNRYFSCNGFNNSFLWISFSKFFREPSSAKDYIEICKKFDWILINEFGECGDDEADRVRRFISFIDVTYKENAKVKFFHEGVDPKNLYIGKKFQYLWERSRSRINEMKSKKYLLNSGKN
jgi:cell division protein ZapE